MSRPARRPTLPGSSRAQHSPPGPAVARRRRRPHAAAPRSPTSSGRTAIHGCRPSTSGASRSPHVDVVAGTDLRIDADEFLGWVTSGRSEQGSSPRTNPMCLAYDEPHGSAAGFASTRGAVRLVCRFPTACGSRRRTLSDDPPGDAHAARRRHASSDRRGRAGEHARPLRPAILRPPRRRRARAAEGGADYPRPMATAYGLLGPLEAHVDGRPARLGGMRQRAVLAVLVLNAGQVVPADRLIDETWPEEPPDTAANVVQGHVSSLRKELGRDAIQTRDPGYLMRVDAGAVDVARFERLAAEGAALLREGRRGGRQRRARRRRSRLWRGPALADLATAGVLRPVAARLDDLRLIALERRLEAELALGPPRRRGRRARGPGRRAPAARGPARAAHACPLPLRAAGRCARRVPLGPAGAGGRARAGAEHGAAGARAGDPATRPHARRAGDRCGDRPDDAPPAVAPRAAARPTIAVAALAAARDRRGCSSWRGPLATGAEREIVAATTVADAGALPGAVRAMHDARAATGELAEHVRVAAFTSLTPGSDLARLAAEQDATVVLVDAPDGLLEDARLLTLLADAPCDVAVVVGGGVPRGPVLVPFTGSPHDWAATELGAWFARGARGAAAARRGERRRQRPRRQPPAGQRVAGRAARARGRDRAAARGAQPGRSGARGARRRASSSSASPTAGAARGWAAPARRWRPPRTRPTLLVRRGLRPGGLAPRDADTRFTWTLAPPQP